MTDTIACNRLDLIDLLDEIADLQTTATCARLVLRGIMANEAGSVAYEPLHAFLLRLESDIGTMKVSADGLMGGKA